MLGDVLESVRALHDCALSADAEAFEEWRRRDGFMYLAVYLSCVMALVATIRVSLASF